MILLWWIVEAFEFINRVFLCVKLFMHVVMVISVFTNLPKILNGSYEGDVLIVCLDSGHCGEHIVGELWF
jgi:hypothetical protein